MKKFFPVAALMYFIMTIGIMCNEYKFEDLGLTVTFPAGWTVENEEGILTAGVGEEPIAITFTSVEGANLEAATTAALETISKQYTDLKLGEVQTKELSGSTIIYVEGSGKSGSEEMSLIVALFPGENNNYLFMHGAGTPAMVDKYTEAVGSIIESVKPDLTEK